MAYASRPADDVYVVLAHPGSPKGKRALDALRKAGAREVACDELSVGQVGYVVANIKQLSDVRIGAIATTAASVSTVRDDQSPSAR